MSDMLEFGPAYRTGYRDGYRDGVNSALTPMGATGINQLMKEEIASRQPAIKSKIKRKQSPKQKLLKLMTDKKWKVYKKGSGKKTYIQIRGEVSRSQAYKKKAKRL
jgi:hypothetical protein